MSKVIQRSTLLALASFAAVSVHAQLKWEGCADLAQNQLVRVPLVARVPTGSVAGVTVVDNTLTEPVKLSVAKNGDVYIAERTGTIKVWKAGTVSTVGKINVFSTPAKLTYPHPDASSNENGLHGIVLDPNFDTNRWLYLHYTPTVGDFMNISRWTVGSDGKLDPASEKILLQVTIQKNSCCHTGGAMEFDLAGNLYVTTGNNTTNPPPGKAATDYILEKDPRANNGPNADDQGHSANTNDLRGKILRIKPTPDGKYTIPAGNLFPEGTEKTRPEIWAMGIRNPYSLAVDKYRGWVAWGDIGPDDGLEYSEEWNLFTAPGNGGWPYFVGKNKMFRGNKDALAPVNSSVNNTGLNSLPPAVPATIEYKQSCAVTGPIFHYNGSISNPKKLPPHLNKMWLVTDWWKGNLEAVSMSEDGKTVVSRTTLKQNSTFQGPLDLQVGPDGALYVIEYGQKSGGMWFLSDGTTAISRLEYTGACSPVTPVPTSLADREKLEKGSLVGGINLGLRREVLVPSQAKGFRLYDVQGRNVWEYKRAESGEAKVTVPAHVSGGLLRVKFLN